MAFVLAAAAAATPQQGATQSPARAPELVIHAQRLLDVRSGAFVDDVAVHVRGERIHAVGTRAEIGRQAAADIRVVEIGSLTLLPGLIDAHTHLMARVPDEPNGYALNLLTKTEAYRTLEGAANARLTLDAGFTTVRDVGNEGSGYADVALRDAIERGLVDGPRMRVATRGIAAIGQYYPFGVSSDLHAFPTGAQMVSGVDDVRRAVREQIGHGADLIKVYADWDAPTLTSAELQVVVEEAHKAGRKVAAHATTPQGIRNAVDAGVDSIEHGSRADRETLQTMKAKHVFLVPTLSGIDAFAAKSPGGTASPGLQAHLEGVRRAVATAQEVGVPIALGSDPGETDRHGRNAEELVAMARRGLSPLDAVRSATSLAAELMGMSGDIGTVEAGKYADLIGVEGDPLQDLTALSRVRFVMKGGRIFKQDGLGR